MFPYAKRSPSHKAVGSHTRRPLLEVSEGGGARWIVDLAEIVGCLLVYWSRGKWWWMVGGGVVGGGKVRADAGGCRCWSCRYLFLY